MLDGDGPSFRRFRLGSYLVEFLGVDRAAGTGVPGRHGHCGSRKSEALTDDEMINIDIGVGSGDASPRGAISVPGLSERPQIIMRPDGDSSDALIMLRATGLNLRSRLRGGNRGGRV